MGSNASINTSSLRHQCIVLQLGHVLDPVLLVRSLHHASKIYPKVASRIVPLEDGRPHFHLETERMRVRMVMVEAHVLSDPYHWAYAHETLLHAVSPAQETRRPNGGGGGQDDRHPLFHAFLLRAHDSACGCVLVVGFEHTLGDAASYGLFLQVRILQWYPEG